MKVLLINPPYPVCESLTMPLGLLYLAARLEQEGHEVALEDLQVCRLPVSHLKRTLLKFNPGIVGITSFSLNLHSAGRLLRAAKQACPEAITVWGGPHVSFDDENILHQNPLADVIVRGEGEETLREIAGRAARQEGFEGVPGATWRDSAGEIHRNPARPFQPNIDLWPRPAWHLLKLSQYLAFEDGASILTSRGCPHRCVFCVGRKMIGASGRFRDPIAVVDEMEALAQIGFRRIRVEDDLFTFRKERAVAICQEIDRRKLSIRWRGYARVDTVDSHLLEWMKKAGCERLLFGAESGSPEILKRIRKGITPAQTRRAVEMTRKAGIGVLASFVIGLPGETPETLKQTVEFADSLQVPYSLNLLTPYVGTEVRECSKEWGIQIHTDDWKFYGQGHPLTSTPTVNRRQLGKAVKTYREGISLYLKELLEREKKGALTQRDAEELEKQRRWHFLRRLIGEAILERFGVIPAGFGAPAINGLAKSIAPILGMDIEEVKKHLNPLFQGGNIYLTSKENSEFHWKWAEK
ncbi:MAG: Radical domain protein [Deltaproteobacteria bacterium]|nr:Radical domain protein [Deltaproteobacteria bacterium]